MPVEKPHPESEQAATGMRLKILLPSQIFTEKRGVTRIVVETVAGSLGLLPHRRDCIAAMVPGILCYETTTDGEVCLAVDEGVLVKSGSEVLVSVRRALGGVDLAHLNELVKREFLTLDDQEQDMRTAMAKLESGFISRFASFHHE